MPWRGAPAQDFANCAPLRICPDVRGKEQHDEEGLGRELDRVVAEFADLVAQLLEEVGAGRLGLPTTASRTACAMSANRTLSDSARRAASPTRHASRQISIRA